jgi:serine/threonine-protein kinase
MPPEQVRGQSADARSDIYSYGVSLYELLTGKLPFQGDSQYSLMTAHLNEEPAAPITMRADLPPALNEIILMAMAKDPAQRFQSADAFRAALKSVPVSSLPGSGTTVTHAPRTPSPSSSQTTLVETPLPRVPTVATPASTPSPRPATPSPAYVPTAVAPQATVPSPAAAPARSSSSRGLWVAIGALAGVSALIAAGIYIPRKVLTHADPNKSAFPPAASSTNPGAQTPASTTTSPSSPSDSGVVVQGDKGSISVDPQGNVAIQTPNSSISTTASGDVHLSSKRSGNPIPPRTSGAAAESAQPATPPVPAGPSPEEIAKVEDEADKLNVRGSAVTQSVDTLRHQQQAAGYNLRGDISAAEELMQLYLSKGNAALKAQDLTGAKKYFDLADAEINKLEKFLGH